MCSYIVQWIEQKGTRIASKFVYTLIAYNPNEKSRLYLSNNIVLKI